MQQEITSLQWLGLKKKLYCWIKHLIVYLAIGKIIFIERLIYGVKIRIKRNWIFIIKAKTKEILSYF